MKPGGDRNDPNQNDRTNVICNCFLFLLFSIVVIAVTWPACILQLQLSLCSFTKRKSVPSFECNLASGVLTVWPPSVGKGLGLVAALTCRSPLARGDSGLWQLLTRWSPLVRETTRLSACWLVGPRLSGKQLTLKEAVDLIFTFVLFVSWRRCDTIRHDTILYDTI